MPVKVLIVEDNPVARSFLTKVVRESFSDQLMISEASDLETARQRISESRERSTSTEVSGNDQPNDRAHV